MEASSCFDVLDRWDRDEALLEVSSEDLDLGEDGVAQEFPRRAEAASCTALCPLG
jgi:hypothetical protein